MATRLAISLVLLMALVTLCILVVWVMILLTYQAYKKDSQADALLHRAGWPRHRRSGSGGCSGNPAAMSAPPGSGVQNPSVGIVFVPISSAATEGSGRL